jgi:GMP synthase (glutamine-hydrolysing)
MRRGDRLPAPDEVDGVLVFGGEQHAGDPTFAPEADFLRAAVAAGLPVLGICLGGQLLARALGGRVRRSGRRTVEWRELHKTPEGAADRLFSALPDPLPALHFNEDVFEPPPGAVELLGRVADGAEAFRFGNCAWAMQFHPDADAPTLARWWREFPDYLEKAGADAQELIAESARRAADQERASRALFGGFARAVGGRVGAP